MNIHKALWGYSEGTQVQTWRMRDGYLEEDSRCEGRIGISEDMGMGKAGSGWVRERRGGTWFKVLVSKSLAHSE